jgi:hypothetical protein
MTPPVKSSVIAILVALVTFVAAAIWGAEFAFPEPDASPEEAAQMQMYARVSGWVILGSITLFLGGSGRLIWSLSRAK